MNRLQARCERGAHPTPNTAQVRPAATHGRAVVAGVHDDPDLRITRPPLLGLDQPLNDMSQLGSGDGGRVVRPPETHGIQQRDPRGPTGLQSGDEAVRPARRELIRLAVTTPVDVAEPPVVAGRGVRAGPVAHPHGQHDPPVGSPRQTEPQDLRPWSRKARAPRRRPPGAPVRPATHAGPASPWTLTPDDGGDRPVGKHEKPPPDTSQGKPPPGNSDGQVPPPQPGNGTHRK